MAPHTQTSDSAPPVRSLQLELSCQDVLLYPRNCHHLVLLSQGLAQGLGSECEHPLGYRLSFHVCAKMLPQLTGLWWRRYAADLTWLRGLPLAAE